MERDDLMRRILDAPSLSAEVEIPDLKVPYGDCWFCRKATGGLGKPGVTALPFVVETLAHQRCWTEWGILTGNDPNDVRL